MASEAQDGGVRIELLGGFRVAIGGDEVVADAGPADAPPSSCSCWRLPTGIASCATRWSTRCGPTSAPRPVRRTCARPRTTRGRRSAARRRSCCAAARSPCSHRGRWRPMPAVRGSGPCRAGRRRPGGLCRRRVCLYRRSAPGALYEEWTQAPRERLRSEHVGLLRRSGQWERLVEVEPTDEPAYRELMRRELGGRQPRTRRSAGMGGCGPRLARELGISAERRHRGPLRRVRRGAWPSTSPRFVGRQLELARRRPCCGRSAGGELGALAVRGPAGIGKSALCREVAAAGAGRGLDRDLGRGR